jgi:hypothetical protein
MSDEQQPHQPPATPPANAAEASTRLETLKNSVDYTAKLLAGDPYAAKEFHDLHVMIDSGDNVDSAMKGILPDVPDSQLKMMAGTAEMLRDKGFTPLSIRETLEGKEATQAEVAQATAWKNQRMRSPEFIKQYLSGEPDAVRQMLVADIILSSPVKKEQAA